MPPAVTYDPTDRDVRQAASDERTKLESIYQRASAWYDGDIPDVLHIKKNPKTGAVTDNNIKINMFAKRVDRRRDFLFKAFPQLDLDDTPGESEAEDWLKKCWQWNKAATLWGLAVLNGAFTGQIFMRMLEPRPNRDKYPRCILLPNVITFWQADDVDTHLWYEIYYKAGKTSYRQDIVDLQAVGLADSGWGIYEYSKKDDDKFVVDGDGWLLNSSVLWRYPLGPIVSWQHWPRAGRCYGAGEFGDIHLNMALNRVISLGGAVIRNHAFPKTVVTGASGATLTETAVDGLWTLPKDSQVFNLEMQSDLSAILNIAGEIESHYNSQGRTVDIEGGPGDFANITNLAIKVSFTPQSDANEILKRQYGGAVIETSKRLQMLGGQAFEVDPVIVWEAALPESKIETVQIVAAEDKLGLASKETQSTQLGLNFSQEQDRILIEREMKSLQPPVSQAMAQPGAADGTQPDPAANSNFTNGSRPASR